MTAMIERDIWQIIQSAMMAAVAVDLLTFSADMNNLEVEVYMTLQIDCKPSGAVYIACATSYKIVQAKQKPKEIHQ